ncbi:hypothetical protein HK102_009321, partial [Quaeritorhiza haematococci]
MKARKNTTAVAGKDQRKGNPNKARDSKSPVKATKPPIHHPTEFPLQFNIHQYNEHAFDTFLSPSNPRSTNNTTSNLSISRKVVNPDASAPPPTITDHLRQSQDDLLAETDHTREPSGFRRSKTGPDSSSWQTKSETDQDDQQQQQE